MKRNRYNKGFSLIEIMVALVVLAVGILGISKLQGTLIRNSSDANQRTVAVSIAQQKIDDLKSFTKQTNPTYPSWTAALAVATPLKPAQEVAYAHITGVDGVNALTTYTETGGLILPSASITVGNTSYSLNWVVEDYLYPEDALSAPTITALPVPSFKRVKVTVGWNDQTGIAQSVALNTVIDAYLPANTGDTNPANFGSDSPIIPYTPELAPDVVPVTISDQGLKKESSKPHPDVSRKGKSTTVKFETVTYVQNTSLSTGFETLKREEFLTALCTCKSSGSTPTSSRFVGKTVWDEDLKQLKDIVNKQSSLNIVKTGVDISSGEEQAAECSICCRDGDDNDASAFDDNDASAFKACRLKRIDGVYRLFKPWRMIAFNVIPSSYFNPSDANSSTSVAGMDSTIQQSNVDLYSDYVTDQVRSALQQWQDNLVNPGGENAVTVDTNFKTVIDGNGDANFVNGVVDHKSFLVGGANNRELQVRAVYLDHPPIGIYEGTTYTANDVPLERVPFFENNFTQVAGWIPDVNVGANGSGDGDLTFDTDYTNNHDDMDSSSCVNTGAVSVGRNYVTNEEFFYQAGTTTDCPNASRGKFYPIVATVADAVETISSRMYTSNDGVVDKDVSALTLTWSLFGETVTLPAVTSTTTIDLTVQ